MAKKQETILQQNTIEKNQYNHIKLTVIGIFAVIWAAFSIMSYFSNTSEQAVLKALNHMEAYKVGGAKNWNALQSLYDSPEFAAAQADNINTAISSLGSLGDTAPNNEPTVWSSNNAAQGDTLTDEQLAKIIGDIPLLGNADADIIFLEYSDFECPFCQRQFDNQIEESLMGSHSLAYSMKQFPLAMHPNAQKSAEGALCVRNLAWDDAFFEYRKQVFASKNASRANTIAIANTIGINESEFTECLDSDKFASEVIAQMSEWQSVFGVNGTPWNVLINKTTGKYVVVSGAQPLAAFENAIAQLQ